MPVDVAMEEPRSGVVSHKPEGNIVSTSSDAYRITTDWVVKVVLGAPANPDCIKHVAMSNLWEELDKYRVQVKVKTIRTDGTDARNVNIILDN